MGAFYETKVHVRGIVLVLDGPRDGVGSGQVGRIIIDEGLDDWGSFHVFEPCSGKRSRSAKKKKHTFDGRAGLIQRSRNDENTILWTF